LDEVRAIADTASVLRDGRLVLECELANTDDKALVNAIVGREVAISRHKAVPATRGSLVMALKGVTTGAVRDVSFDLHAGESIGLTGLAGMGQDAIPEALLGITPLEAGEVAFERHQRLRSPRAALRAGMVYLPPSRARGGCIMSATVAESITMATLERYFRRGRIDRRAERADTMRLMEDFDVRPRRPDALMGSLSGGNQQKCLLAKLDHSGAQLLVLHEPTHGVDVGAREQVLAAINRMKAAGRAIVVISNEYEDLERICDRVLVFAYGAVKRVLTGHDVSEQAIAAACLQATESITGRDAVAAERPNSGGPPATDTPQSLARASQ
jgi:ribose transport system ATP-binding protein